MKNKLSNNLTALMEVCQIGGTQLARATKIPLSTIKNIRKGEHVNPTIETLVPLACFFGVSIEDILNSDLSTQTRKKLSHSSRISPHPVPVITWEEAISWSTNMLSHKQIFTEKPCKEAFALSSEQSLSVIFPPPGFFLIDPAQKPSHLDYVLVHKVGLDRASIRQFLRDEDHCYLKSLIINNNLVEYNQSYQLLGVIIEYRQFFKSKYDEKKDDFILCKEVNKLALMKE